jgi:hypothetical protein
LFNVGTILYLSPFYFKNGNTAKNKYFIVLKNIDDKTIIAALPTRKNQLPSFVSTHGCSHDPERCINCYAFEPDKCICENGFSFPIQTFIYGNEVEDYHLDVLKFNHKVEGVDYEILGELLAKEYENIVNCLKQSTSLRRGVKKFL